MRLRSLFSGVAQLPISGVAKGVTSDSRKVTSGDVFFNLATVESQAIAYSETAMKRGAVLVVVSRDVNLSVGSSTPTVAVDDVHAALAVVAARFYQHPSDSLDVVGVTGTNGKTTVAFLLAQLLDLLGRQCAYVGTLGVGGIDNLAETGFTTPPADVFQGTLQTVRSDGFDTVAVEISSHALAQKRVDQTHVRTAVFTNLSQDHLDYHSTMNAYAAAKQRLFSFAGLRNAVINIDDDIGRRWLSELPSDVCAYTISLHDSDADLIAKDVSYSLEGMQATLVYGDEQVVVQSRLIGGFNVYNLLLVIAVGLAQGYRLQSLAKHIPMLTPPPGRMQCVQPTAPRVLVDFAHTPDALASACLNLKRHLSNTGKLILVFGCGGDRDVDKRPKMGEVASTAADLVVLTSDNPRSEKPEEILDQILQGVAIGKPLLVEVDRAAAIRKAIAKATEEDIVLIAGKGHETYQIIGSQRVPFSDVQQAKLALEELCA